MTEITADKKRTISLFSSISMMTGCIVGASVFVVPGELAFSVGPAAWLSYVIGAVLMFFNCFIYAQVGSVLPVSGANYVLCSNSVNGAWGFLYVWGFLISNIFLFPIMSRTAASYLAVLFPVLEPHVEIISFVILGVTIAINLLGTDLSTKIQNLAVVILVVVILVFSFGGIANANWSHFDPMFPKGIEPVILGAISTYYAYAGVNNIIELAGEIKNPGKNIPRTVFISFVLVVLMYVGMCVALVGLIPANELNLATPAVDASRLIFPDWFAYFVAFAAIAASWTTLNAVAAGMSRLMVALGKVSILPKSVAKENKYGSPYVAYIILLIVGVIMMLFSTTIIQFVNISSFYLLFVALLVAVASLNIKKSFGKRYEEVEYKLKGISYYVFPILAIVTSIIFMVLQFQSDLEMTGLSVLLLPLGLLFYYWRKNQLKKNNIDVDEEISKQMS